MCWSPARKGQARRWQHPGLFGLVQPTCTDVSCVPAWGPGDGADTASGTHGLKGP